MSAGPVGKCASSSPMILKKILVKISPFMVGMLEGVSHPMRPKPITE